MLSGVSAAGNALFGQIQTLQAQRNAEQAEQRARGLQQEARVAQQVADQAQERATSLQSDSAQARVQANGARSDLRTLDGVGEVQTQLEGLRDQIAEVLSNPQIAPLPTPVVTNLDGQLTGRLINVSA